MPNKLVRSFAKRTGKTVKREEHLWNKAKEIVTKQYKLTKKDGERFYQLVVGVLERANGMSKEEIAELRKKINEETVTGDVAGIDKRVGEVKKRREPDGVDPSDGIAFFDITDSDIVNMGKLIDDRVKWERWRKTISPESGIQTWANDTLKPFKVRLNGVLIRVR